MHPQKKRGSFLWGQKFFVADLPIITKLKQTAESLSLSLSQSLSLSLSVSLSLSLSRSLPLFGLHLLVCHSGMQSFIFPTRRKPQQSTVSSLSDDGLASRSCCSQPVAGLVRKEALACCHKRRRANHLQPQNGMSSN